MQGRKKGWKRILYVLYQGRRQGLKRERTLGLEWKRISTVDRGQGWKTKGVL
jgi:hypothetical protein